MWNLFLLKSGDLLFYFSGVSFNLLLKPMLEADFFRCDFIKIHYIALQSGHRLGRGFSFTWTNKTNIHIGRHFCLTEWELVLTVSSALFLDTHYKDNRGHEPDVFRLKFDSLSCNVEKKADHSVNHAGQEVGYFLACPLEVFLNGASAPSGALEAAIARLRSRQCQPPYNRSECVSIILLKRFLPIKEW